MLRSSPVNKLRLAWQANVPDHVIGVAWSPDGQHLAAAAVSGPVAILDANTGKPVHSPMCRTSMVPPT